MNLPFRSLFLALAFVLAPAVADSLKAEPRYGSSYYGDTTRRPLDGSSRVHHADRWEADRRQRLTRSPSPSLYYDGVPMLAPIWTGLYAGVHGGGGWGTIDTNSALVGDLDMSGAVLGAHLGYLVRANAFVIGGEIDADWSLVHDTKTIGAATLIADNDYILSARLRLGVMMGPALIYATGGWALGGFTATAEGPGGYASKSGTQSGGVLGGGVEIGLNERMAFRIEALHYFMDEQNFTSPQGSVSIGGDLTTVRAGLTVFFN